METLEIISSLLRFHLRFRKPGNFRWLEAKRLLWENITPRIPHSCTLSRAALNGEERDVRLLPSTCSGLMAADVLLEDHCNWVPQAEKFVARVHFSFLSVDMLGFFGCEFSALAA